MLLFLLGLLSSMAIPAFAMIYIHTEANHLMYQISYQLTLAQQIAISREKEVVVEIAPTSLSIFSSGKREKVWDLQQKFHLRSNYPNGRLFFQPSGQTRGGTISLYYQGEQLKSLQIQVASGKVTWQMK
jgi:Tfp pilus assembly protein FimT